MNRNGGLMAMLHGPDDVLRSKSRIAAKEDIGPRRLKRHLVGDRHMPLIELNAEIGFNPRKRILLADGENHVVTGNKYFAGNALGLDPIAVHVVFELLEHH